MSEKVKQVEPQEASVIEVVGRDEQKFPYLSIRVNTAHGQKILDGYVDREIAAWLLLIQRKAILAAKLHDHFEGGRHGDPCDAVWEFLDVMDASLAPSPEAANDGSAT